jgi:hypothetical protein
MRKVWRWSNKKIIMKNEQTLNESGEYLLKYKNFHWKDNRM